jgi:hypothetical protein
MWHTGAAVSEGHVGHLDIVAELAGDGTGENASVASA